MSFTDTGEEEPNKGHEIEIRLIDIVQFLKSSRRLMIVGALIGLLIGALYAFSKHNMYTSEVTVLPEIQGKGAGNLGGLGSLAGLAGINLDNVNGQDAIRPDLYPNVLLSVPFALHLLEQRVYSQKLKGEMSFKEFIYKINDSVYKGWLGGLFPKDEKKAEEKLDPKNFSQAVQVTKEQDELIKIVQNSTTATYDKKTGMLLITAIEPDPVVAATVARLSLDYLTNYVTTYRTEKARKQVDFLLKQVLEAKSRYQYAELALSSYRDRNRNLYLNTAKIDEQRLQADYILTQTIYNDLSKQLEQAKIKVQEDTPVFKTLEPPTIPLTKSGPKRTLIMFGFMAAGVAVTFFILLIRLVLNRTTTHIL
ncbi:Wzz/FepE/Etk N-terminal domain-containing protein [Spirosoma agri]|uniref:Lipopolysaccharide biosynthesis protein n=1 Tax=Spirosoma agri TaxID=1987381 RepID=A0A6M0ILU8_9BACT|nr:Wzz/FepE/Etk N-terminal domain-containing protein [Spirosoma agri]NEU68847.1 lipopolysaccharide biosynthesis protein [Spirosoma agri]